MENLVGFGWYEIFLPYHFQSIGQWMKKAPQRHFSPENAETRPMWTHSVLNHRALATFSPYEERGKCKNDSEDEKNLRNAEKSESECVHTKIRGHQRTAEEKMVAFHDQAPPECRRLYDKEGRFPKREQALQSCSSQARP